MKTSIDRARYFLRKTNSYSQRRFDFMRGLSDKKPPSNRYVRLLAYKAAFHLRIDAERGAGR